MGYISLSYSDILIALTLVLIPIVISFQVRLGIEKEILIGTLRTFVQLMIVGYVLKYIFDIRKWYIILLMVFLMTLVAGYNAVKRQKTEIPHLFKLITISIFAGAAVTMMTV